MADDRHINGYTLLEPLKTAGGGQSRWSFATRDGRSYFIKEFLDPVYPLEDSPFDEAMKQAIRLSCEAYQRDRTRLYARINQASDGNAVRIEHFFRWGSRYYITTKRIMPEGAFDTVIQLLGDEERLRLCLVLSHILMELHNAGIVYADLKPDNILLEKTEKGCIIAKLIDFDASFFAGSHIEELTGDQIYFAPEAVRFINEGPDVVKLDCKLDVFAAGLIFHRILTGQLPELPEGDNYAFEALLNERKLRLSSALPLSCYELISGMLERKPEQRYSMAEAFAKLKMIVGDDTEKERPTPSDRRDLSRLVINGLRIGEDESFINARKEERQDSSFYRPGGF